MGGGTLPGLFSAPRTGTSTLTSDRFVISDFGALSEAAAKLRELGFEVRGLGDDPEV